MSTVRANAILDSSGGNTAQINGMTPTAQSLQGFRNRIINGDMRIDQRNNGASVTVNSPTAVYPVDRFFGEGQSADGVFTLQRSSVAPSGFTNSVIATVTTADSSIGASQYYLFSQSIEGFNVADLGWGTSSAQPVTLSFWVRSSVTGTFGGVVANSSQSRSYPYTFSISSANTWEYKTVTITGDTTGTWLTDNGIGMRVRWSIGAGSSIVGTANAWAGSFLAGATGQTNLVATSGATFFITGVQLEAGSVATPFERRDYGRELAMCQRYYWQGFHSVYTQGGNTTSLMMIAYPATMRASPTANWSVSISANVASFTVNGLQTTGARSVIGSTAAGSAEWTGTVFLSAEL